MLKISDFQKELSLSIETILSLRSENFSKETIDSGNDHVGVYIKYVIREYITIYIYTDQSEVHDERKESARDYHFENYESMTLNQIKKDTEGALKHLLSNSEDSDYNNFYFNRPQRRIQIWPIKWPWSN